MAVGFTPKHIEEISTNEFTQKEALVLLIKAAEKLKWQINYISPGGIIAYTNSGAWQWNAEITIKLEDNKAIIRSESAGNDVVDWGKNKKTVAAFTSSFNELRSAYTKEELHMEYLLLEEILPRTEEDQLQLPPETGKDKLNSFLSVFKPVEGYFVTPILININILIFILMLIGGAGIFMPETDVLIAWGANFNPLTLGGQWWRLISCCFIHIGIIHLLFNMYALLYIGTLLEPILGRTRFITAYLLTGLMASMNSMLWHNLTVAAGASGAIFGMYGVFLALLTTSLIEKESRKALLGSMAVFVVYNLAFGLQSGIDNAAHIGGLISGFIMGYAFVLSLKKPENKSLYYGSLVTIIVAIIAFSVFIYDKIPNDVGSYQNRLTEFSALEEKALNTVNLPENVSAGTQLAAIQHGIQNWKDALAIMEATLAFDLPESLATQRRLLKEYCELRLKSFELYYKQRQENSTQYDEQLEELNRQIKNKLDELNKIE